MSVRNPSAYTQWLDRAGFRPGELVLAGPLDDIVDDQTYLLDQAGLTLVMSGSNDAYNGLATYPAFTTIWAFQVRAKDCCGAAGGANDEIGHAVTVCLRPVNAGTAYVRLTSTAVASNQVTFSNGTGTLAFGAYQTLNLKTNGIVDTITVTMAVSGGSIGVVCPVLAIFSPET